MVNDLQHEKKVKIKLDFCGNCAILVAVMRDNERAIREGIRKRAEKGGDMSVLSVLPWLKDEKRADDNNTVDGHEVVCCGCGAEVVISLEEVGQWDHGLENYQCWECE